MHTGDYIQISVDDLSKLQQSLNLQVIETDKISSAPIFSGDVLWNNPNNYRKCKKKFTLLNGELFRNTYDNSGLEFLIDHVSLKKESIVSTSILK